MYGVGVRNLFGIFEASSVPLKSSAQALRTEMSRRHFIGAAVLGAGVTTAVPAVDGSADDSACATCR